MTRIKDSSTENTNQRIHNWLDQHAQPDWVSVDLTAGNGHDTLKLAQLTKKVIAVDIQPSAIEATQAKTKDYEHVHLYQMDHVNINEVVNDWVHLIIMNCGYLPNHDKSIKTTAETTLMALTKVERHLRIGGYFIITCYPGHRGGKKELETVQLWLGHHPNYEITIFDYPKPNTPITFIAKKLSMDSR